MSRQYTLQRAPGSTSIHIDYPAELNEQQLAAVTAPPGPLLVIAGAGSGKTRTLTYRVAYLLEQGIAEDRILLLTFTNKAAREMMGRVTDLLGQELAGLWGATFHSIGNRILRLHAERLGYGRGFTIMDRDDATHLIRDCITEGKVDTAGGRFPKAEVIGDILSMAANTRRPVEQLLEEHSKDYSSLKDEVSGVQSAYESRKRAANAMDYDDLLSLWLKLLLEHEDLRKAYLGR